MAGKPPTKTTRNDRKWKNAPKDTNLEIMAIQLLNLLANRVRSRSLRIQAINYKSRAMKKIKSKSFQNMNW